jgi:hypothetical protein
VTWIRLALFWAIWGAGLGFTIDISNCCRLTRRLNAHVVAVLDDNQKLFGRTMCGVPVVGSADQLDAVIEEFAVHGVHTDRVIIGGDETLLSAAALSAVRETCAQRDIVVDFVPNLIGLAPLPRARPAAPLRLAAAAPRSEYEPSAYFRYKRVIDFIVALVAIVIFSPLFLVVSVLVWFDFGAPVVFWQKRIGRNGKSFLLYKFRTLHAPFDRDGQPNGNGDHDSWIGKFLRRLRLDELPQLFQVLVGEMSLIGPRPLLPKDQPANSTLRLMVRPGITVGHRSAAATLSPHRKKARSTIGMCITPLSGSICASRSTR